MGVGVVAEPTQTTGMEAQHTNRDGELLSEDSRHDGLIYVCVGCGIGDAGLRLVVWSGQSVFLNRQS